MASRTLFHLVVCLYTLLQVPIAFCAPKAVSKDTTEVHKGNCNFNKQSLCKWRQENVKDNFDWTIYRGRTPSSATGPSRDRSGKGYYAYIETSSPRKRGQTAQLINGPFSDVQCLHFSYSMVGDSIGALNIYRTFDGLEKEEIWSKSGRQYGPEWRSDNVTVYGKTYYVTFEGVVGHSYAGDIAIDDIYFTNGSCRGEKFSFQNKNSTDTKGKCSFDLGLCDWANDLTRGDTSPWRLSSYRRKMKSVIQRPDHGKDLGGKYVYAMPSRVTVKPKQYRLVSEKVCGPKCVELFYFTHKFQQSEFRLSAWKNGQEDRLWFSSGAGSEVSDDWTRAVVEINAEDETCFQLVLEANLRRQSAVGLDDVLIANGSCCPIINTPQDSAKANCDFDQSTFCDWRHSMKSTFFWSIGSGATTSGNASNGMTGPTADSSGSGKYAYIESSEPRSRGDKAVLVSDLMAGQQCMRFKYHMHGEDVGSLSVYRRGFLVWKEIGNHGNRWLEGQVDFDCSISQYHVEIEATVGGWRGDIAIDDLRFTPGICPTQSTPRSTPPVPTTAPPAIKHYSGTCTFDNNLCSWTNALDDHGEWKLQEGDTPSFETGPHYDSDGNGYYVYMEASDLLKGQTVRLESHEFFEPICLHFHYYMYGKDIGQLRLEQRNLKDNSTKVIWNVTGEQEDYWHFGSQDFYGEHYTVSFVGVRGDSWQGDISIDEIGVGEADECKLVGYAAKRGNPKEGNCAFDDVKADSESPSPLCKWINMKGAKFEWTRQGGRTPSGGTGPSGDHTGGGKYLYIETSSPRRMHDKAVLLVKLEGKIFCMRFWYHMYGATMGSLEIMRVVKEIEDDDPPKVTAFTKRSDKKSGNGDGGTVATSYWLKKGNQGNKWREAEFDLGVDTSMPKGNVHWIGIVGTVGSAYTGDIAIDDIEFTDTRCSSKRKAKH